MNTLLIGLSLLGAWKLGKALGGTSPMRSSAVAINEPIQKTVAVRGRLTFLSAPRGATRICLYFHGFGGNIMTIGPKLAKLVDPSMALVMPQLGPKSEPGDLASPTVVAWMNEVRLALGLASQTPIYGVAHSGGYRALASTITSLNLQGAALLDALYGQEDTFIAFARSGRCLIDLYGPGTEPLSNKVQAAVGARSNVHVVPTTTFHPDIPEAHLAAVSRALVSCLPV